MLSRRGAVAGLSAVAVAAGLAGCSAPARTSSSSSTRDAGAGTATRHSYGSLPSQFGELRLPIGARRPGTVVLLHGGYWLAEYGLDLMDPIAEDIASRGWAVWNLEYRRVGSGKAGGGGWPTTLEDVAAGIDQIADPALKLDLTRTVVIGHSAGGQLAAWAAARSRLPSSAPGATPKVSVTGVISLSGVLDLRRGADQGLGGGAVTAFLGGTPAAVPTRYSEASPIELLPTGVPVRCIHGRADTIVPLEQSTRYVDAARKAGDDASLTQVEGDHFAVIDATSSAWKTIAAEMAALLEV